jgi:NitT/TauT family transport system ATP-binding protein
MERQAGSGSMQDARGAEQAPGTSLLAPPTLAVEATGVHKTFVKDGRKNHVLSGVPLTMRSGEFVALIGPSGCGKSTFLRILAGLTPYDAGEIRVLGREPGASWLEVGFVFQSLALLQWRTVTDNVLLPAEFAGLDKVSARERALRSLQMVGLEGFERYHLREISGGMRQRVALARVLMQDAKFLLLDEPFSALDELTRESIDMLFMSLCEETGASALLVTHSVQEAVLLSDRVLVMSPGPSTIVDEVVVDIPRPRDKSAMRTPEFTQAVERVREGLGLEG